MLRRLGILVRRNDKSERFQSVKRRQESHRGGPEVREEEKSKMVEIVWVGRCSSLFQNL